MPRERLHEALTTLHRELETGGPIPEADRELLETVADEVRGALEAGEAPDLRDRVEQAATEFEAEHPRLSGILGEIVEALARMGI
jgi:hypothetical protein